MNILLHSVCVMWHMFGALFSEFIYVLRIGPHIGQGQLIDLNFAKPPFTRQSALFRVFKVTAFITGNILIMCFILSRKKRLLYKVLHNSTW